MDLPEGRSKDSRFAKRLAFAFAAGFGSGFVAFLAFSFAANSCLTLRATASVSTPYAWAAARRTLASV